MNNFVNRTFRFGIPIVTLISFPHTAGKDISV